MRRRANHFNYPQLARNEGVNPAIGQRARNGSSVPTSPPNSEENDRLYDAIVLAISNHEETYNLVKAHLSRDILSDEILKEICERIPNTYLPENYNMRTWDNLNWESLRSEVIENLFSDLASESEDMQ